MTTNFKVYQGSCHCRNVQFEIGVDLTKGTIKCNCSLCTKLRCWSVIVGPNDFRLKKGADFLNTYRCNTMVEEHFFCNNCSVRPYNTGDSPRWGKFYAVNVTCLDNLTDEELAAAPIIYLDGRNDNWTIPPRNTLNL